MRANAFRSYTQMVSELITNGVRADCDLYDDDRVSALIARANIRKVPSRFSYSQLESTARAERR
jgi:hypothetical protein